MNLLGFTVRGVAARLRATELLAKAVALLPADEQAELRGLIGKTLASLSPPERDAVLRMVE